MAAAADAGKANQTKKESSHFCGFGFCCCCCCLFVCLLVCLFGGLSHECLLLGFPVLLEGASGLLQSQTVCTEKSCQESKRAKVLQMNEACFVADFCCPKPKNNLVTIRGSDLCFSGWPLLEIFLEAPLFLHNG